MNIDEKKKMKNFFMDSLHEYFYKEETQKFL